MKNTKKLILKTERTLFRKATVNTCNHLKYHEMKNKFNFLYLLVFLILSSCYSTEEEVFSEITSQNVYNSKQSTKTVLWSCYDGLQKESKPQSLSYGSTNEIMSETWFTGARMMDYNIVASDPIIYTFWKNTYSGINRCNVFIENVEAKTWEDNEPSIWVAEAKVIRAYHYFNLVRSFGEVPLILESTKDVTTAKPSKNTVVEIYNQILNDLNSAKDLLPLASKVEQQPRFSKGTAQGLLMSVYATMAGLPLNQKENWNKVVEVYFEMKAENQHKLNPSYQKIFENQRDEIYDIENREILMEVAYSVYVEGEGGSVGATMIGRSGDVYNGGSYANYYVPKAFVNSYPQGDVRKGWNVSAQFDAVKYVRRLNNDYHPFQNPINWIIMRYSEVLLLYAEALNEINNGPTQEAFDAINLIRYRARPDDKKSDPQTVPDLLLVNFADNGYELFKQQIIKERSWELCFEGQRWYDLKRWGILYSTVKDIAAAADPTDSQAKTNNATKNVKEYHVLYPIPQQEIDINANLLPQNQGY